MKLKRITTQTLAGKQLGTNFDFLHPLTFSCWTMPVTRTSLRKSINFCSKQILEFGYYNAFFRIYSIYLN